MTQSARKAELLTRLDQTRERTLSLFARVPDRFYNVRVHDFYSPVGWHFGHIGMTEEHWAVCRASSRRPLDSRLSFLFANLPENPKDNRVHLPGRGEVIRYLQQTRAEAARALEAADLQNPDPLVRDGYAWEFAMQHECQHQETITELLQLIHQAAGVEEPRGPCDARPPSGADCFSEIFIRGGAFIMGSNCRHGYDNEKQEHETEVHSFYLDAAAVTVADWLRFIGDGGYRRPELWQPEGWEWKAAQLIEAPEYWLPNWKADAPRYFGPFGVRSTQLNEPVTSVSWFEADAYSRWAGKRLPTEEEWEYAAAWDAAAGVCRKFPWGEEQPDGVLADFGGAGEGPAPVGAHPLGRSAQGVGEMAGGVWEWTSSRFLPYPGFAAFPYDGYSAEHMDGSHYVCRGGSWASAAPILRCSFRNWYVPTYRQGFLGLRCAR